MARPSTGKVGTGTRAGRCPAVHGRVARKTGLPGHRGHGMTTQRATPPATRLSADVGMCMDGACRYLLRIRNYWMTTRYSTEDFLPGGNALL